MNRQRSLGTSLAPRELFPWLSAGVSLQMINSATGHTYINYDEEKANLTTDPVFLIVSDKTFHMSVMFRDKKKTIEVDPFLIRWARVKSESYFSSKEEEDAKNAEMKKKKRKEKHFLSLKYGLKFCLTSLDFVANCKEDAEIIATEINCLRDFMEGLHYNRKLDSFLNIQFDTMATHDLIKLSTLGTFMKSVSGRILMDQIKNSIGSDKEGMLREEFKDFYRSVLNQQANQSQALTFAFFKNCKGEDKFLGRLGVKSFEDFLTKTQKEEDVTTEELLFAMESCATRNQKQRKSTQPHLSFEDFLDFLFSPVNDVADPAMNTVHQDMTQPLPQYFINSSHNTYLTGNQLTSESSAEAYGRVLRQGARCIELDCWDGSDNKPIITHGRTVCTKIKLWDVLVNIRDNAFATSPYPVVLSIEDHCCVAQQAVMADMFLEAFGERLLTRTIEGRALPSPEELKYKIILKHKYPKVSKVQKGAPGTIVSIEEEPHDFPDFCLFPLESAARIMEVSSKDPLPAIVTLVESDLEIRYIKYEEQKSCYYDEVEGDDEEILTMTREEAEELFRKLSHKKEGFYIIRTKTSNKAILVITVYASGSVRHIEIKLNGKKYRLGGKDFDNLSELIKYYKDNAIVTKGKRDKEQYQVYLEKTVPRRYQLYVQHWYIPNLLEEDANRLLACTKEDGTFLVRDNTSGNRQILSFLSKEDVIHVYVDQTEHLCKLGGYETAFPSFMDALQHFKNNAIFRQTKLTRPYSEVRPKSGAKAHTEDHTISKYVTGSQINLVKLGGSMSSNLDHDENMKGNLEAPVTVSLAGAQISAISTSEEPCIRITPCEDQNHPPFFLFVDNIEEWLARMLEIIHPASAATVKKNQQQHPSSPDAMGATAADGIIAKKHQEKFAQELLNLVVCCRAVGLDRDTLRRIVSFNSSMNMGKRASSSSSEEGPDNNNSDDHHEVTEMNSFSENKAREVMEGNRAAFQLRNDKVISRVYPKARRTDSSNFNPVPFWLCGVQMCALNFQTASSKESQVNQGWFRQNGGCGYVLKPEFMRRGRFFDPTTPQIRKNSFSLKVCVVSGRHLGGRNIRNSANCNVYVKLEVVGCHTDCAYGHTNVVQSNGLNPSWDEMFDFGVVHVPSLAVLRISAHNQGKSELLGQACVPLTALRLGYRSVQLKNGLGESENGLSTLLLHIEKGQVEKDDVMRQVKRLLSEYKNKKKLSEGEEEPSTDGDVDCETMEELSKIMSMKTLMSTETGEGTVVGGIDGPRKILGVRFPIAYGGSEDIRETKKEKAKKEKSKS